MAGPVISELQCVRPQPDSAPNQHALPAPPKRPASVAVNSCLLYAYPSLYPGASPVFLQFLRRVARVLAAALASRVGNLSRILLVFYPA